MTLRSSPLLSAFALLAFGSTARAQLVTYTDEATFLDALTALSLPYEVEGFESDAVWGGVRSTIPGGQHTAPSVHSNGITWYPNVAASGVTTSNGAARSGQWGFFELPHGDPGANMPDGFIGVGDSPLVAVGGWIETNTPYAGISLYIDGTLVNFGGSTVLDTLPHFFGVIDTAGFSQFEFRETEAMPGDWKYIFCDDFRFAFDGTLIDCNQNGVGDALDISSGASEDCNLNAIPDECEIDAGSTAPGGPYFCQSDCESDCNQNGQIDSCEVLQPTPFDSGPLGPIGTGFPQSFTIASPPPALADVLVDFSAYANFGGGDEYLDVRLNGTTVGRVYEYDGEDCPSGTPAVSRLIIPRATFTNLVGAGAAQFDLLPSLEVDPNECDQPSHVTVVVTLFTPSALDQDGNGIPDTCQSIGTSYCTAAPNSASATGARISAFGSTVVADDDFTLFTYDLPPNQYGVHFFGPNQVQLPFGDGFRCVGGGLARFSITQSNASGHATQSVDLSVPPGSDLLPGTTFDFQFWFRDPSGGPAAFNLSDGLEVAFQ